MEPDRRWRWAIERRGRGVAGIHLPADSLVAASSGRHGRLVGGRLRPAPVDPPEIHRQIDRTGVIHLRGGVFPPGMTDRPGVPGDPEAKPTCEFERGGAHRSKGRKDRVRDRPRVRRKRRVHRDDPGMFE